jgi:GNAT superfamily N-acetyltransferase
MYYRKSGRQPAPPGGLSVSDQNRKDLKTLVASGTPPGLIGYQNEIPIGWISLGPREDYAKLRRSPVMKPVDAASVWSIVCFVVPSQYRGQGVSRALLNGAIDYAKSAGVAILEAYPVDKAERSRDDAMFFGAKSIYDSAGFNEVARRKPTRPIVRLTLADS